MKNYPIRATVVVLLLFSVPVFAHHGNAGYDMAKMTVFQKATITQVEWGNPHCQIHFDVTDDKGTVEHWLVEAPPPSELNATKLDQEIPQCRG